MTEAAERWSACSIATAAWPRTWRQPADRGVTWRSQGRWRRARPHRRNSETGSNVLDAIGHTPLIKLRRASEMTGCTILGKAEFMNPGESVKDRAARPTNRPE